MFSFEGVNLQIVRDYCDEGTPVPIPNTVVKLIYGDNTWLATAREDNSTRTRNTDPLGVGVLLYISIFPIQYSNEIEAFMYQYILFDLDGTLTDPREGITKSVQYALDKMGISEPDLSSL